MKSRTAISVVAAICYLVACGPKTIEKKPVSGENRHQAILLMAEGDRLLREDKEHLALLKYVEASQLDPYEEMVFNKLALAYCRLLMYPQARSAVNRAIGLNRTYAYAYNTRGILELSDQRPKDAARSFAKAVDLKPDVASFYVNLGYAEGQKGNTEAAVEALSKAQEIDPIIFDRQDLLELGSIRPVDPEHYYKLALVFAELDSLSRCLFYLEKAFTSGFEDYDRLASEPVLQGFKEDPEYQEFLRIYGANE
jgi:tetratricopeptide (TPR) repeat protein